MKNKIILLITSLILSLSFTTLAHAATNPHIDPPLLIMSGVMTRRTLLPVKMQLIVAK